ncbi:hypothetical protein J6590_038355 [Homalodisca vitripennis]|nr:hypothetical protein J6590_038355 [Homalodisca vitripennis]
MGMLLRRTEEYLKNVGMSLSAPKCGAFHIQMKGDALVTLPVDFTIQGQPLQLYTAGSTFDYLGLTFGIRKGFQNQQHLDVLCEEATRRRSATPDLCVNSARGPANCFCLRGSTRSDTPLNPTQPNLTYPYLT